MKIEKLSFENLNSLCGHFEIDFTERGLTDAGMFVITGPTGSGKTTILDAVCWALYRQTPRLGKNPRDNRLMTTGCDACMAQLEFEHAGRRYRVRTEQRRTRSGAATAFAAAKVSLEELSDGTAALLTNSVTGIDDFIRDTLKLDFKSFCRCIMLPQGGFAEFLRSDGAERGAMLEKITGTDIYQRLGERAQEHYAAAKAAVEALKPQPELPAEERAELVARTQEADLAHKQAVAEGMRLEKAARWLADLHQQEGAARAAAEAAVEAQQALRAFQEGGQAALLAGLNAAQSAAPAVTQWQERRNAERQLAQALAEQAAELTALEPLWENSTPTAHEARIETIQQQLVPLDRQLAAAETAAAQAETARRDAEAARAAQDKQSLEAAARAEQLRLQHGAAVAERERLQAFAPLKGALSGLETALRAWKQEAYAETALPEAEALRTQLAEVAAQLAAEQPEALLERRNRLEQLQRARSELAEARRAHAEAAQRLAELPSLAEARHRTETRREVLEKHRAIAGIEEQLAALYEELREGRRSCCPLCGAEGKPTHEHPHQPGELERAQAAYEQAAAELRALETRHRAAELTFHKEEQRLAQAERAHQQCADALPEQPADIAAAIAALDARRAELTALTAQKERLQQQLSCRAKADALLSELWPHSPALPRTVSEGEAVVQGLREQLADYTKAEAAEQALAPKRDKAEAQAEAAAQQLVEATAAQAKAAAAATACAEQLRALTEQRRRAWGTLDATAELTRLSRLVSGMQQYIRRKQDAQQAVAATAEAAQQMERTLTACGFADVAAYAQAAARLPELEELRARETRLRTHLIEQQSRRGEVEKRLGELRAQALTTQDAESLAAAQAAAQATIDTALQRLTDLSARLKADDLAHAANEQMQAQLVPLNEELARRELLFRVLGGTKDSFRRYAQQITFGILVEHANRQLRKLNDRYELMPDTENLSLRVRDAYLDNEEGRDCANLSGGESFVVSLALALGLANMAGETRIDSLFLDEGFGTLDEHTLHQVLDSLQELRAEGKLIGIISHVEQLREQLPQNIELISLGNSGLSTISDAHPAVRSRPEQPAHADERAAARAEAAAAAESESLCAWLATRPDGAREKELRTQFPAVADLRAKLRRLTEEGRLTKDGAHYRCAAINSK